MADFDNNLSLEDALTDNPPEIEAEVKRDFISTLEAEPYDDLIGETCDKCDYIPLLDDDAAKSGNQEHIHKPKTDGNHVERAAASQHAVLENGDREIGENFMTESSRVSMDDEKMYSEFRTQKEPWQLEPELCFEPQPVFQPVQQPVPFEANKDHDLLSELLLLPSSETKSRPAFTEHFGASGDLPEAVKLQETHFFSDLSDARLTGALGGLSPQSLKDTSAPTNNAAFQDDWLGDGHVHAEEADDLEDFAKKAGSPGEMLSEHSPWEDASFPVETTKDDHTGSHWQPTIQEQQVLGMHHASEPSHTAEFALREDSSAAVTLAEMAGEVEFSDWQHTEPTETLDKNGNIPEALTFDEAAVPEAKVAGGDEFFPKQDLLKESTSESITTGPATALVGTEMAEDEVLLQQNSKPRQEEAMEIEKHKESEPEALTCDAAAVNEVVDEEVLPQQSSHQESDRDVLRSDADMVSLVMEDESSLQQSSSIPEDLGLDAASPSLGLKEESSQYQNANNDRASEVMGLDAAAMGIAGCAPFPYQNPELQEQYHEGSADDVEQKETIPVFLPLDTATLRVDRETPENKTSSQLESETHQEQPNEFLASALTRDQGEHLLEAPSLNAFNIPSSVELQDASPHHEPHLDPLAAPAVILIESDVIFTEVRAPADGACTVEDEKHIADPCPVLHTEPVPLLQPSDVMLDELKVKVPDSPAPAAVSPLEDHKFEPCDQHTEEHVLETSVNLEASSAAEAIAGSITAPPSKELPPSPEKKSKPSAVAASAKPAAAKGRPASTTSPKQSTPPPGKTTSSPAPVASSTPKRPGSSSARPSNLTPKDSTTPRSATLTPKEMKPKGLDLKSPIKSPEKRTPVSKPSAGVTPRAAVKPATGTPKAAMVPAVAVASTTGHAPKNTTPRRPTTIKADAKPVEAKKMTTTAKSADLSRPKTAPVNSGKSNATTPSSPGTNTGPAAPINRSKPSKPVTTKPIPESNATTDGKKVPSAKAPVSKVNAAPKTARPGSVPAPDLKNVRSKIGSTDNLKYQPGGGRVQILSKKVDTSKATAKCGSKVNLKHKPGGGDVKIENHKSNVKDKVQSKVGSLDNMGHVPAGGKVKSEGSENAGDMAQSPQNGDLSMPQALAGSETQQNEVPTEGSDQRETQNFDTQIQETN